jgi:hypothetical protein
MTIFCSQCGFSDLVASRIRLADWRRLLLFRLPVRCRTCRHRMFVSLAKGFRLTHRPVASKIARVDQPIEL